MAARDAGVSQPSAAVLLSPWVDLTLSGASMGSNADVDVMLTPDGLRRRVSDYAGAADVAVQLDVTPRVPHVFQAFAGILDEGHAALTRAGASLQAHFEPAL